MNIQELFDLAVPLVIAQGVPSVINAPRKPGDPENRRCAYRGPNGTKCAIGHALPDKLYDPWLDTEAVDGGIEEVLDLIGYQGDRHVATNFQNCHDRAAFDKDPDSSFTEKFIANCRTFALTFGLDKGVLTS